MDKLTALVGLYKLVDDETSFEEENIGIDLALLTGAILTDVPAVWPADRPLLQILARDKDQPAIAYALQYVRTEDNRCIACVVPHHDVCALTQGCPCCDNTIATLPPGWDEPEHTEPTHPAMVTSYDEVG
jgi:hypothetical protein